MHCAQLKRLADHIAHIAQASTLCLYPIMHYDSSRMIAQAATFAAFLLMQFIASRYPQYYGIFSTVAHGKIAAK